MFKFLVPLSSILFFVPTVVFASPRNFTDLIYFFIDLINIAISVVISLAVLGFFWGLSQYILSARDSTKIEEGRKVMIYGILGLFIAVSIWGILKILVRTFL